MGDGASEKVMDALLASFDKALEYNSNVQVPPAALLWPDKEEQWRPLIPSLTEVLPNLLILGHYQPELRQGPAIWIRCMIARRNCDGSRMAAHAKGTSKGGLTLFPRGDSMG
mgnify:CR=1 FL=1